VSTPRTEFPTTHAEIATSIGYVASTSSTSGTSGTSGAAKHVRQRVPAAERRDALIDAAIEEFAHTGLHGTPVDRIARRVGVAQPYVFSLFPTKRDLFVAAVERGFELVMAVFSRAAAEFVPEPEQVAELGEDSHHPILKAIGESYIALVVANRAMLMLQLQAYAACDDEVIREHVNAAYARLVEHIKAITDATPHEVDEFLSHGMWLNVQAAIGVEDLLAACEWMRNAADTDPSPPAS
jgi:AcrR family transcriptional regulator